jgi:predicted component of type VI protein secretion system
MIRYLLFATSVALVFSGCSRSPAEQLAYLHAEQQYQINLETSARFRAAQRGEASAAELPFTKSPNE